MNLGILAIIGYAGLKQHVDFNIVKVLIIASPGFIKDSFVNYIKQEAAKTFDKEMLENSYLITKPRFKFLLVHSSSGQKQALNEILVDPTVQSKLQDTKFVKQQQTLQVVVFLI